MVRRGVVKPCKILVNAYDATRTYSEGLRISER